MTRGLLVLFLGAVLLFGQAQASPVSRVADSVNIAKLRADNHALMMKLVRRTAQRDKAQRRVRRQYLRIDRLHGELRRAQQHYPSIPHLIDVGAAAYGQSSVMLRRKAECESGFWPFARNNPSPDSPMGLFQFRPSTWDSTPFRRFSIWDPWAQALAASWMHSHLRGGEWACK